jgi:glycosyltransferase involved in cell wall biosynthesis
MPKKLNNKSALVSVLVPCFNASKTIERAFSSIINQTLLPQEVIFIDDGSSDSTLLLLRDFEKKYKGFVKVVSLKKNSGVATARNIGWNEATQPYLAFLDSDDAWHPSKLELQYHYMNQHPDVVLSGHDFEIISNQISLPCQKVMSFKTEPISTFRLMIANQFITPSVMLKRSIANRFDFNQRHMEDHRLWLDIAFNGGQIVKLKAPLAAIYKPSYGFSGLSSQLWLMERSDILNIKYFHKMRYINKYQFIFLLAFSLLKYVRRILMYLIFLRWMN